VRWLSTLVVALTVGRAAVHAQDVAEGEAAPEVTPPRVVEAVAPDYPLEQIESGHEPIIALHVTIEADGTVSDAHSEGAHLPGFDEAAIEAVHAWRFVPAMRGGVPVRSRVRVEVRFRLPLVSLERVEDLASDPHDLPALVPPDHEDGPEGDGLETELAAEGVIDPLAEADAARTGSDYEVDEVLGAAPRRDAGDLLNRAPGVWAARGEGDGVAHSIFLRGFDAEHGQDIELTLEGIPLNLPSHIHGQGYADLGFLMPEVVRRLRVREGVYDPRQGDFATAGSIDFRLGVPDRRTRIAASYGLFDTFRGSAVVAPARERDESFVAGAYRTTSGFGEGRAGQEGTAIASWGFGDGDFRARLVGAFFGARYGLAGLLRRDDLMSGRVGFYDQYDEDTARAQGAFSLRALASVTLDFLGARGSFAELGAWVGYTDFRLAANYTGFVEISRVNPEWRGRGDLLEQMNETVSVGLRGRWRSEPWTPWEWLSVRSELGATGRLDLVGQSQRLIAAPLGQTWDERVDASIRALDVGLYGDLDVSLWQGVVHLRGGLRADVLSYGVDDRLGNFIPRFRREMYIEGYRRSALGLSLGPRVSLEVRPLEALTLGIAYGEGYRSPQARTLADGESAPFSRVRSGDLSARVAIDDVLEGSLSGFLTTLGYDVAFDPGEGRLESIGPTTRIGAALATTWRPWDFLLAAFSATYVHATLDAPPLATPENPSPPYTPGQLLPYVAPWVVRGDVGLDGPLATVGDHELRGELGVGASFLSSRPLPYGQFASPVGVMDARGAVSWGPLELAIDLYNLTDSRYAAIEYAFASSWTPDAPPSRLPARHFSAGSPFTLLVTLAVQP
jgi:TonB family protein